MASDTDEVAAVVPNRLERLQADSGPLLTTSTTGDDVVSFIRAMIFSGELASGNRLPPSRELAAMLGVSVVTLRVALKSLETAGFVTTGRGSRGGTFVSPPAVLRECWMAWMARNADQLDDLFELRETVETRLAWLAAERRTDEDLAAIEEANSYTPVSLVCALQWNVAFLDAVAAAAHSPHLQQAMVSIRDKLFLPFEAVIAERGGMGEVRADHTAISDAIHRRDPVEASEKMRDHIHFVRAMYGDYAPTTPPDSRKARPHR